MALRKGLTNNQSVFFVKTSENIWKKVKEKTSKKQEQDGGTMVYFGTRWNICHSEVRNYGKTRARRWDDGVFLNTLVCLSFGMKGRKEGKGAQIWEMMDIFQYGSGYYLRSHNENEPTNNVSNRSGD